MTRLRRTLAVLMAVAAGAVGVATAASGPAAAGGSGFTVYLSPTGNDSADGLSAATAILSLQRAEAVLKAAQPSTDVEVRIAPGTYQEDPMKWHTYVPGHTISFLPVGYDYGDGTGVVRPVF